MSERELEIALYAICAATSLTPRVCEEISGAPSWFMEGIVFNGFAKRGYSRKEAARHIARVGRGG